MTDNGNGHETKDLDLDAIRRSVQALPQSLYEQPRNSFVLHLASAADDIMPWGKSVAFRDKQLRQFWPTEPTLAGAVTSVAATRAAYSFTLDGPPRTVKAAMDMLQNADFGKGLVSLLLKTGIDILSQDNGAFTEVIREADRPDSAVLGLAHLDAGQCVRTGIPEVPVLYTDPRTGIEHKLKWYQVVTWEEMPSPIAVMNNVQYSAVTRVLRAAQILRDIAIYRNEKVAGRRSKAIHFVGGAKRTEIEDARKRVGEESDNEGFVRYMEPIIIASLDPNTPVSVATLDLASLPDGFDMDKEMQWYITQLALGFGGDYLDLAPLPGKGLGSAKESETMSRKSRGKGPAIWMKLVAHKFNYHGILPSTVEWRFDDDDLAVDKEKAEISKLEAEARKIDIESGVLTPQVARQMMADEGKLDEGYLTMLGEQDVTENETLTDTQQIDHEEEVNASGQPQAQPIVSNSASQEGALAKFFQSGAKAIKSLFRDTGQARYTKATNAYERRLLAIVKAWISNVVDDADSIDETDEYTNTMAGALLALGETELTNAYILGLQSGELSLADQDRLREMIDTNARYVTESFIADAKQMARRYVNGEEVNLEALLPRISLYAGPYWAAIWNGTGARVTSVQAQTGVPIQVERILDANAKHCLTCPPKAGVYDSWASMLQACGGVPGDGSDECVGRCRCSLRVL